MQLSESFIVLKANSIFSSTADIQVRVAQATRLTQDLAQASSEPSQNTASLLPASINATNEIAAGILNLLFESLESGVDVSEQVNGIVSKRRFVKAG